MSNNSRRILWLDNDTPYIRPYVKALRNLNDYVDVVASLSDAEKKLETEERYNLVIIDVMVPTQSDEEVRIYPFIETDYGHKTGLVFYKRIKAKFGEELPEVVVMTVRLDQDIKNEFVEGGLRHENFLTKYSVKEVADFLKRINAILARKD